MPARVTVTVTVARRRRGGTRWLVAMAAMQGDVAAVSDAFMAALEAATLSTSTCLLLFRKGDDGITPEEARIIQSGYGKKALTNAYVLPLPGLVAVVLYFASRVNAFVTHGLVGFECRNVKAATATGVNGAELALIVSRCCTPLPSVAAKDQRVAEALLRSCAASELAHTSVGHASVADLVSRLQVAEARGEAAEARAQAAESQASTQMQAIQQGLTALEAAVLRQKADMQLLRNTLAAAMAPRIGATEVYPSGTLHNQAYRR